VGGNATPDADPRRRGELDKFQDEIPGKILPRHY